MIYLLTNVTDADPNPRPIVVSDIPHRLHFEVKPGQSIDLELLSTRNQICQSLHIKVHVEEGRATVDTLGTEPGEDCRLWVNAKFDGEIVVDNITIEEPLLISGDVGGQETAITAENHNSQTYLNTAPLLPNTPEIHEVAINTANTEYSLILPNNAQKYMVYSETSDYELLMGFQPGGNTITIPCSSNFAQDGIDGSNVTLYFQSEDSPQTVKVVTWSVS